MIRGCQNCYYSKKIKNEETVWCDHQNCTKHNDNLCSYWKHSNYFIDKIVKFLNY